MAYQVQAQTCKEVLGHSLSEYSGYEITQKSLKHIIDGDIVNTQGVYRIKGGMHTHAAYVKFVESRPDFVYVEDVNRKPGQSWYYSIESGTGARYVRLPTDAYTAKSLKSLWGSDLSLNGGFLWKTLFPENFTQDDIIKAIRSVLNKPDAVKNRGWAVVLEGRYKYDENLPSIALHVVVNTKDKTLVSAYPSFEQGDVDGNSKGLISFKRQVVFSTTTTEDLIWEEDTSEVIDRMFHEFLSLQRRMSDPEWWSRLNSDQKRNFANEYTFTRVNLTGANVGGMDMLYQQLKVDSGYVQGDVYGVAAEIAKLYVEDRHIDSNVKYDYLKNLITSLLANDLRMVSDTLWAKFVLNLVLQSERQFEKPLFESLISLFVDSPVLWTLLIKTRNPLFLNSNKVAQGVQAYMLNFSQSSDESIIADLDSQVRGFSSMFDSYKAVWRSEFSFIKRLSNHPDFQPSAKNSQLVYKLLIDYLNSFVWKIFKANESNSSFIERTLNFAHLKQVLSLIKVYDSNFDKKYAYSFIRFFISPNISDLNIIRQYDDLYGDISVFELIYENRKIFVENRTAMPFVVSKGKAYEFIFVAWKKTPLK